MFNKKRPQEDNPKTTDLGAFPPKPAAPAQPQNQGVSSSSSSPSSATPTPPMPKPVTKGPSPFMPSSAGGPRPGMPSHGGSFSKGGSSPTRTLVVGNGISVQGTILDAECLIVEGIVDADHLHAQELIVAHGGMFRGKIEVENAELSGTVDGNLVARNSLTVQRTGRLLGKAECRRLQVEDGGQITGEMNVITTPASHNDSMDSQKNVAE